MADAVLAAASGPSSIYEGSEWASRREEYQGYRDIFDGGEWEEITGVADPDTGQSTLRYPLQINPAAKVCRTHRAVMFGMREDTSSLPVKTLVSADGGGTREEQLKLQQFVNSIWRDSQGAPMLEEAGLLLQIYGGHYFKVAWEFWNSSLPYRIAVRSLKSPGWCLPIYDIYDPWHLLEAYIGYKIPASVAKVKYGITVDKDEVLYLEHWTRETWKITVDDKVPVMQSGKETFPLEGEHEWGLVPIVYIPHERTGSFYGESLIADMSGLARELNARMADIGDAVRETAHRMLVLRNARSRGAIKVRKILSGGRFVGEVVDIGDAPVVTGAKDPDLFAVDNQGVPESVASFPGALWKEIRRQADVAAVAMGDEDMGGGRITGPVTAWRMFPSIAHTMTERAAFSTGLNIIAGIIATIAAERERAGAYAQLGIAAPGIASDASTMKLKQVWYPPVPIEDIQKVQALTLRLQSRGVSLHTYLERLGEDNVDEEIERIWEDFKRQTEIETEAQAKVAEAKGMPTNPSNFTPREAEK
jgi:hypothetical protein